MKQQQLPLLEAQTTWFHVFRSMLDSGDVAKIGPHATTVYLAIKAYTNWQTGKSWPGIELIVEKTGISKRQVLRSLAVLEESGYITKEKSGRHNVYRLREKVPVFDTKDGDMRPVAEASWDYLPSTVKDAVAELKKFTVTGNKDGLNIIQIENLTLNIQQNIECRDVQQNIVGGVNTLDTVDWQNIPEDNPVKRAYLAAKKQGSEE
jgi:DNA-binding transcriptional ArsR family regulator